MAFLREDHVGHGAEAAAVVGPAARETFEINRAIYDVPRADFKRRIDELGDLLELGDLRSNKPTRQLSLGERMKCELAAALVHGPKVLFLDEPTIGLDVSMQVVMRDFIRRYNEQHGATLILTSHYMDDVAAFCPRVIVIDKGTLSFDGKLEELVQKVRPEKRLTWCCALSPGDAADAGRRSGAVVSRDAGARGTLSGRAQGRGDQAVVSRALVAPCRSSRLERREPAARGE
jgi:ABC-2 type transport system ATP-binding protein